MLMRRTHSAIGMDIGKDSLKMVQFRTGGHPPRRTLLSAAKLDLAFPNNAARSGQQADFVNQMKKFLGARKFGARRAVVTLPASEVEVRPLTLPVDEHDVAKSVKREVKSYLNCDPENAVIDHIVLGEAKSAGERRLEVLTASVEKSRALSALDLLARAGIVTEAIDIVPLALCRLLQACADGAHTAMAAVDIGALSTHAVIIDNQELRMTRNIDIGGDALTQAIATALEIGTEEAEMLKRQHGAGLAADSEPEAAEPAQQSESEEAREIARIINDILRHKLDYLAGELGKLFRYFSAQSQGQNVERVLLVGGGSSLKHLDRCLAENLNTQVEVGAPLSRLTARPVELKDGSQEVFAVAAGLALREI